MTTPNELPEQPNMPKVPPSIWIALATATIGVSAAFGLPLSSEQSNALIALVGVLSIAIPGFDTWLRRARLAYLSNRESALARAAADQRFRQALLEKKDTDR